MIVDRLTRLPRYYALSPLLSAASGWLARNPELPDGRYDVRGDDLYAMVQSYRTSPEADAAKRPEAHRRYVDLQLVTHGSEVIEYAPLEAMSVTEPYDEAKDVVFLSGAGSRVRLGPGEWMILRPEDVHRPGLTAERPAEVRKVVFKLAVSGFSG